MRHLIVDRELRVTFCKTQLIEQYRHKLLHSLSPAEQALFHSHKLPHRSIHFLGGRVLAKYLLSKYSEKATHHPWSSIDILPSYTGSPELLIESVKQSSPLLSIAHTQDYILSTYSQQPAGCDVERIGARFLKVAQRYASPQEHQSIHNFLSHHKTQISTELLYTCLWTSKESLTKYFSKYSLLRTIRTCTLQHIKLYPPHSLSFLLKCQVKSQEHELLHVWHLEHANHIFSCVQTEQLPPTCEELTEAKLILCPKG